MSRRRGRGRPLNGVIVLDKPCGETSNEAVQFAKRQFSARRVGHTGSLDPLATGVLPLCFGEATKFSRFLLGADKRYVADVRFGVSTDSGDADGSVVATREVKGLTFDRVNEALERFRGEFEQTPSMFSAIKHNGTPLYKLARKGIEVERQPRSVTVFSNVLEALETDRGRLSIHCTKGTYVRCIVDELGELLGCGAHVIALRRTMVGPLGEEDSITKDEIVQAKADQRLERLLQPISTIVRDWPDIVVGSVTAFHLQNGQPVIVPHAPTEGWVRLCEGSGESAATFLGVGEILEDGRVAPRRLVVGENRRDRRRNLCAL